MSGPIDLRNCRFNGVFFDHISLDFESDKRQHYYRNLKMVRSEGAGSADLVSNNLATKQFVIEKGHWTLPPVSGMRAFSPKLADKLTPYRFHQPPVIELSGTIDARKPDQLGNDNRQHDLDIKFSSDHALSYQFLGKDLLLEKPAGHLQIKGDTIHLTNFTANTLNGSLSANYQVRDLANTKAYSGNVEVSNIDFKKLTQLYSTYESTTGDLNANAHISGIHGDLNTVKGTATTTLRNGDVFAIPMMGPLSIILKGIMPNAKPGHSVAKEASADFTLLDGIVRTENFEALTPAFRFKSSGSVKLSDKRVNLDTSFHIRGPAGILLAPVSKILEYNAAGTVSNPGWKPKYIPRILPKMGTMIPGRKGKPAASTPTNEKPKKKLFNFKKKTPPKIDG